MKERLTSFDVAAVTGELDGALEGASVQKTYQVDEEELRVRLYREGRLDLVVSPERVHLTRYPKPAPRVASNLSMAMRKRTRGGFVRAVEQHGFDRVLSVRIGTGDGEVLLVVEMFGEGNVVLVRDGVTEVCLNSRSFRDRKVVPGEVYGFPPSRVDPSDMGVEELGGVLRNSGKDLVRGLATELGLGGLYAEETVSRSGLEKHLDAAEMSDEDVESVHGALRELFDELDGDGSPQVVYREGEPVDAVPLDLERYGSLDSEGFDSFNEALDAFFSQVEMERVGEAEEAWNEETASLEERLEHQEEAIASFEEEAEEMRRMGDALYEHYGEASQVLEAVRRGRDEGHSFDEIAEAIEGSGSDAVSTFEDIRGDRCEVILRLDGESVGVDFRVDVPENAERLYERGKRAREKMEGARRAALVTRERIGELKERGFEADEGVPRRPVRAPERWYHRFRWFRTSSGDLVVAGRDASQNEELVKRHLEKEDLFLHTEVEGAPVTILKGGQGAPGTAVEEAAVFALSNSAIWKGGAFSGDVYAVGPEQVSKTPESGEYLPKGSFAVRGKRRYFRNLGVSHCVGLTVEDETRVMGGPCSAVRERCRYWVELEPGDLEKSSAANEVRGIFDEGCADEDALVVEKVATQEEVARALPPGGSRVVGSWR
ncbi:MAG: hypothetical protein MAG715_00134 [Methanonatronarchaeales archaeon]|nr:hypothetical protein [Methanonatronarchaeales archaeon]